MEQRKAVFQIRPEQWDDFLEMVVDKAGSNLHKGSTFSNYWSCSVITVELLFVDFWSSIEDRNAILLVVAPIKVCLFRFGESFFFSYQYVFYCFC